MFMHVASIMQGSASFPGGVSDGLTLWLDANSLGLNDNDGVFSWPDKSGNDFDMTATGGSQPVFKTNQINGKPAVQFIAAGFDLMFRNSMDPLDYVGAGNATVFVAAHFNSTAGTMNLFRISGTNNAFGFFRTNTIIAWDHGDSASGGRISTSVPGGFNSSWHYIELIRNGQTASSAEINVDGSNVLTSNFTDDVDTDTQQFTLSRSSNAFDGYIAEVLMYDRTLNGTERSNIEGYMNAKYGL